MMHKYDKIIIGAGLYGLYSAWYSGKLGGGNNCFNEWPHYTIAIRTLGTAGDKFLTQLGSIHKLTPAPKSINVYIPYGYAKPKIPYDDVKFIRCDKGMVAQRAISCDEIKTDWILFLDDDIVLPEDGVARLFRVAKELSADCVSVDHKVVGGMVNSLKRCMAMGWWPHRDADIAFKVGMNGEYTYSRCQANAMNTECVCFQNFLVSREAHIAIRYDEERWIDKFGYAIHDELVYATKLIGRGYSIASYFADDFRHLNAKCGHSAISARSEAKKLACRFATWHRNVFNTKRGGVLSVVLFISLIVRQYLLRGARCSIQGHPQFFAIAIAELWRAWRLVHSEPYRSLKPLDADVP